MNDPLSSVRSQRILHLALFKNGCCIVLAFSLCVSETSHAIHHVNEIHREGSGGKGGRCTFQLAIIKNHGVAFI